jgi:CRISPR-associated protein Cmr2
MRHDYWAAYAYIGSDEGKQRQAIDYLLGSTPTPPTLGYLAEVSDPSARVELLAQALATSSKSYAQSGDRRAGGLKKASGTLSSFFQKQMRDFLGPLRLVPDLPALEMLPGLSFALRFSFALRKPYLSRNEAAFYVIDNPVRKEKVFGLPYIAPTQWKGALRATMVRQLAEWYQGLSEEHKHDRANRKRFVARRAQLTRLFGTEKDVQPDDRDLGVYLDDVGGKCLARWYRRYVRRFVSTSGFCAGRLCFYPTYFTQIGLEVINPHSRETGAGELPILLESVPAGATGTFALLYVPLGSDEVAGPLEIVADLEQVAEGLKALFLRDGFGAKTSSGFGVAEEHTGAFQWAVHHWLKALSQVPAQDASLAESIVSFMRRFSLTEFPRWNNIELEKSGWGSSRASEYKRLRNRHPDWDQTAQHWREPVVAAPRYELLQIKEASLDLSKLPDLARDHLAAVLRQEAKR